MLGRCDGWRARGCAMLAALLLVLPGTGARAEPDRPGPDRPGPPVVPGGVFSPNGRPAGAAQPDAATVADVNWLAYVNQARALAALPPVTEEASWSAGAALHSRYMVKNSYVGHDEDPGNPWYSPEGRAAGQSGNAFASTRATTTDQAALDGWLTVPFHLLGIVDPRLTRSGYGAYRESKSGYQMAATLDVIRGISYGAPVTYPVLFPANGTTMPFARYGGSEYPDPLTSCPDRNFQGPPLMIQLAATPQSVEVALQKDGVALDRCVFDESTYANPDASAQGLGRAVLAGRHAVTILPRAPLTAGTYQVTVRSRGVASSWSFFGPGTAPAPSPTHTPSPTPTATPTPTSTPLPVVCVPRPPVGVAVARTGPDGVLVTVMATGTNNLLQQLRFGAAGRPLENARVLVAGQASAITGAATVALPAGSREAAFTVERASAGRSVTVPFAARDGCGDWETFVGFGTGGL